MLHFILSPFPHRDSFVSWDSLYTVVSLQDSLYTVVSPDFGEFFILLDRYEVCSRAGSGLFFILKTVSFLNFLKKVDI
jgi:hypothetical protein